MHLPHGARWILLQASGCPWADTYLKANEEAETNKSTFHWKDFLKSCEREELIKIILEMSPNNTDIIEGYRMANLPTEANNKLKELKSKIDELYTLAETLEEYYDEYNSFEQKINEEDFIQQRKFCSRC